MFDWPSPKEGYHILNKDETWTFIWFLVVLQIKRFFATLIAYTELDNLFLTCFVCSVHFKFWSIWRPRNFVQFTRVIFSGPIRSWSGMFGGFLLLSNIMYTVLLTLRDSLFARNQSARILSLEFIDAYNWLILDDDS